MSVVEERALSSYESSCGVINVIRCSRSYDAWYSLRYSEKAGRHLVEVSRRSESDPGRRTVSAPRVMAASSGDVVGGR